MTGDAGRRGSAAWHVAFRIFYRFLRLVDPLIRSWIASGLPGLDAVVDLRVAGRRTGRPRRILITLLQVDGGWYVGHPDGDTAWTRNVAAAGVVTIEPGGARGNRFRAVRLTPGPERTAVVAATARQQPFPGNLVYRAARRHIEAVGVYHRLDPLPSATADVGAPTRPAVDPSVHEPEGDR